MSVSTCPGDSSNCDSHFHDEDTRYPAKKDSTNLENNPVIDSSMTSAGSEINNEVKKAQKAQDAQTRSDEKEEVGFRRIILNFTPSHVPKKSLCAPWYDKKRTD
jgi:hypothetical protein